MKFSEPALPAQTPYKQQDPEVQRTVVISQVITEPELLSRSQHLEEALSSGQYVQYCEQQVQNCCTEQDQQIWNFLKVNIVINCISNK